MYYNRRYRATRQVPYEVFLRARQEISAPVKNPDDKVPVNRVMGHSHYGTLAQSIKCTLWRPRHLTVPPEQLIGGQPPLFRYPPPLQPGPPFVWNHGGPFPIYCIQRPLAVPTVPPLNGYYSIRTTTQQLPITTQAAPPVTTTAATKRNLITDFNRLSIKNYSLFTRRKDLDMAAAAVSVDEAERNIGTESSPSAQLHNQIRNVSKVEMVDMEARIYEEQEYCEEPFDREATAYEIRSMLKRMRRWELTPFGQLHMRQPQNGVEFTILSYNVLAQSLLEKNQHLYKHCHYSVLNWEYRWSNLLREIRETKADIICLQEVEQVHFDEVYLPVLSSLGYDGKYKKRTHGYSDGCAIFYKTDLFFLESHTAVEYYKKGIQIFNRDNVALILVLRPKGPYRRGQKKLCVANTHLLFNPGRGDIKLAQVQMLMAEIDKLAAVVESPQSDRHQRHPSKPPQPPKYHPTIVCGDMNSEPQGHLYQLFTEGALRYEGLIAGDISGQKDGARRGRFYLEKELVPVDVQRELGISDQCRYLNLIPPLPNDNDNDGGKSVATSAHNSSNAATFSSGVMSHALNLRSVHSAINPEGVPEVTTHHSKASCMVDYIFYSGEKMSMGSCNNSMDSTTTSHDPPQPVVSSASSTATRGLDYSSTSTKEDKLKLLCSYGLLSSQELYDLGGLPNAGQPSDHIPLVARFLWDCS